MTDELKPVPCGCGGETRFITIGKPAYSFRVMCKKCHCVTGFYDTEAEAITAWNRAMGERKKGKWKVQPSTGDDRPFIWWKCSVCGHVIFSETERDRREFHAFCGRCGAEMRGDCE